VGVDGARRDRCRHGSDTGVTDITGVTGTGVTDIIVAIVAGTRKSARLLIGSVGMMLNIEAIFAMCWVGFMVAVSIKVGHYIGAADAATARHFSLLGISLALLSSLAVSGGLYASRHYVVRLYTHNSDIAAVADTLVLPTGLLITFNALNCTIQVR
jgi:Na+-driven multidrug efflux pump